MGANVPSIRRRKVAAGQGELLGEEGRGLRACRLLTFQWNSDKLLKILTVGCRAEGRRVVPGGLGP